MRPQAAAVMQAWEGATRTTSRGLISETRVLLRLLEIGCEIFVPWGHDHKGADLVAIYRGVVRRVQVKTLYTARGKTPVIRASSVIYRQNRPIAKIVKPEDCDVIAAFCPTKNDCFAAKVTGKTEYGFAELRPIADPSAIFGDVALTVERGNQLSDSKKVVRNHGAARQD